MAIKERNPLLANLFKTPQSRTYTVAAATLLLTVVMIFFVIRPSLSRILTQISENKERRNILEQMSTKFSTLESLIAKEQEYKSQVDLFNNEILPDNRREDEFIANIAEGTETRGLVLLSIGVQDAVSIVQPLDLSPNLKMYSLSLSVKGERTEIEEFVVFIEEFPRVIHIDELVISRATSEDVAIDGAANSFRGDIKATVYYWEEEDIQFLNTSVDQILSE